MSVTFQLANPIILAVEVEASMAWYADILGFRELFREQPVQPAYAGMARDGVEIHFSRCGADITKPWGSQTIWLNRRSVRLSTGDY